MEQLRNTFRRFFGRFASSENKEETTEMAPKAASEEASELHPRYLLRLRIQNALRKSREMEEGASSTFDSPSVADQRPLAEEAAAAEEPAPAKEPPPPPPIPSAPVFLRPPLRKPFMGRLRLLNQLRRKLVRRPQMVTFVSQNGIRGVGSSALAAHLYYSDADKLFPDGTYWLDLRGGHAVSAMRALLHALEVDSQRMRNNLSTLSRLLHQQLEGKRALLVLDNAHALAPDNPTYVLRQIEMICLPAPSITIVTSCLPLYPTKDIKIDLLSDLDGLAFLRKKLAWKKKEEAGEREKAVELIQRLGGLPLALEITAQRMLLDTPRQSCAVALAELEDARRQAEALHLLSTPEQYLAETFVLSYNPLPAPLKSVFHALGVCARTGTSVIALAHILKAQPHQVDAWLVELALYSLVEYDKERGHARLHPLLHHYATLLVAQEVEQNSEMTHRHQQYFKEQIADAYQAALNDKQKEDARKRIDAEADNVRLAQQRAFAS